jgi:hypothetical protein
LKFSPYSERCIVSFGRFPGIRILYAEVSEHSLHRLIPPMKMEQTECSETSAYKIQTLVNHLKERIQILVCFTAVLEADCRGLFPNITTFA